MLYPPTLRGMGALLIAGGSALFALFRLRQQRRDGRRPRDWASALQSLAAELEFRPAPMEEVCRCLADGLSGEAARFFSLLRDRLSALGDRSFSALWRETAGDLLSDTDRECGDILAECGEHLGHSSLERQLSALSEAAGELSALSRQRGEKARQGQRLLWGLTLSGAVTVIILLW